MVNNIIERLLACGFKVDNRGQIFKTSGRNSSKEKAGQLNDYSVYFYAQNVAPFNTGTNTFKEILGNDYVYTEYKPVEKPQEKTHIFSFEDYKKTTKAKNEFQIFVKQYTKENPYDIRGVKSGYLENATLFPYIDYSNNFQTAKIVKYNSKTGKRIKADFSNSWFHAYSPIKKQLGLSDKITKRITCFFGEHLVAHNNKPIVIVEAEKTAIILSLIFKDIVFIASGGLGKLKSLKYDFLLNRDVFVYPDNGAKEWFEIGKKRNWFVSEILENKGTKGSDAVDYLDTEIGNEIAKELKAIEDGTIHSKKQVLNFSVKEKTKDSFCVPNTKALGLNYYWDNAKKMIFRASRFNFFENEFDVLSANIDFNKWELTQGKYNQVDEKTFLERLEKCFRILKELNPERNVKNPFVSVLNHLLENSNFLFNRDYILSELLPLWDNDKNDVSEYLKMRNWRRTGSLDIGYNEFMKELNNDRKRMQTHVFISKLQSKLDGKFYVKPQDIGLKSKQMNEFVWNLIKEYNTEVLGCKTKNNFHKKVELATWLNTNFGFRGFEKFCSTYIDSIDCKKNRTPPKIPSINKLNEYTGTPKTIIREYLSFKPNLKAYKDILTKVEFYLGNINSMNFERIDTRIVILNDITLNDMMQVLSNHIKNNDITAKTAYSHDLDLKDSVLNIPEIEAVQKDNLFLTSWILFNYPDLNEIEKMEAKSNPLSFLQLANLQVAS